MTTTIKVTSHNYPAQVEIIDKYPDRDAVVVDTKVLFPEDGEQYFYCTTNRILKITDLEYNDPKVLERKDKE